MSNESMKVSARGASVVFESERDYRALLEEYSPVLSSLKRAMFVIVFFTMAIFVASQKAWLIAAIDHEITDIRIQGELNHVTASELEGKLADLLGKGFLTVDLEGIKAKVESFPWVDQVTVSRIWPGAIHLEITEQVPVGYWNENAFLNDEGVVFQPENTELNMSLPILVGVAETLPAARVEMLTVFSYLQNLLTQYELSIKQLELKPRGVWEILLENGIAVSLGAEPLDDKVHRLGAVFTQSSGIDLNRVKRIDARYPNGVAIEWKEEVMVSSIGSTQ